MAIERSKERIAQWDFVKGVLIVCVVWGHICAYISGDSYEKNLFTAAIRLFQMPMFIFISGYFQKDCVGFAGLKNRLIAIVKKLIIPYGAWIVIAAGTNLLSIRIFAAAKFSGGGYRALIELFIRQANVLWYLGCLILCELLYCFVSWISKGAVAIALIVSLPCSLLIPKNIWNFSFMWAWFIMGILFKQWSGGKKRNFSLPRLSVMLPICTAILGLAQLYPTKYTFYSYSNYLLADGGMNTMRLCIIIGRYICYGVATGAFMALLFGLYQSAKQRKIVKYICDVGQNTLGIFVIHIVTLYYSLNPYISKVTEGKGILRNHELIRYYVVALAATAGTVVLSCEITRRIKRCRLARTILLGG